MISHYRGDNYVNIDDVEYVFGYIDNYYRPILASSLFNNGHQRYHFRRDPDRNMSVITYFNKIVPYLRALIDENKLFVQKIQLDIGINMVHISEQKRITHFSKSDNVICLPSSNTIDIVNQLLASLYQKYQEDLGLSHASNSFTYKSVEECNIHFNKIDLRRGATYIESPKWVKNKKATTNPKNTNDVYCFMYAATIALYHDQVDIALNVLYMPPREKNRCPEYISKRNFHTKNQTILLNITDESEKRHFLALPSILDEDGVKRPTKSLSRLMEDISSKSQGDFYCDACLHSFCTQSTLKNHAELCKYNKFWKIELPKEDKNIKQYVPGAISLKMNSVIYVDFESIL